MIKGNKTSLSFNTHKLLFFYFLGATDFECHHEGPTAYGTKYDGTPRPRFPLVYSKPEEYDKQQKEKFKNTKRKPDFLRSLMKVADDEEAMAANGQVTDRSQLSSIHAF